MPGSSDKIYVLPGMGADSSMYRGEWRTLDHCVFLDWPAYRGERTLLQIAERLVQEAGIREGSVLVGHSLGGMIACEVAKLRDLKALVLVSSARRPQEVRTLLKLLHHLAPVTPLGFLQRLAARWTNDAARMFSRSDPGFIRATSRAVFQWSGLDDRCVVPKRIHGRRDPIIPLPPDVDCVLNGGHLIPKTHARECVQFVRSVL